MIALSCDTEEMERKITETLLKNNMDYTRSARDIEIIYTNAKERFYGKGA